MGNAKDFFYDGWIPPESIEKVSEKAMLAVSHGSYICQKLDRRGYLSVGGHPWLFGAVHSFSTIVAEFINYFVEIGFEGEIILWDSDLEEGYRYTLEPQHEKVTVEGLLLVPSRKNAKNAIQLL